jgi:hypothetical protein
MGVSPPLKKRLVAGARARRVHAGWRRPWCFNRNLVVICAGSGGLATAYIATTVKVRVTPVKGHKLDRTVFPPAPLQAAAARTLPD